MTAYLDSYRNRAVLVTGGLGFIGSNLCRRLADLGARVTAVDSLLPDYGGNLFNLDGYEDKVTRAPRSARVRQRLEPMKPRPPVTSTLRPR